MAFAFALDNTRRWANEYAEQTNNEPGDSAAFNSWIDPFERQ